jgi:ABC-type multidrug transport system fused ATPase/permease subunit
MANKTGAIISAAITLILFVGIPYLLPDYIPADLAAQIEQSGFNLADFSNQIMMIGVVTAVMTLVGGFVEPTSVIALLVKIAQAGFSLVLIIVFLGAGSIANLGYTTFDVAMEGVQSTIAMDLRVFVYLSIGTILLKVIQVYLEWNEERIEAAPPGRIAP